MVSTSHDPPATGFQAMGSSRTNHCRQVEELGAGPGPGRRGASRVNAFWEWFDREARPKLGARSESFACALKYLDTLDHAPLIIETGCLRKPESWAGDGQSTLIWAKYAESRPGAT